MTISCPQCNKTATVPDFAAGRTVKCRCGCLFKAGEPRQQEQFVVLEEQGVTAPAESSPASAEAISALKCTCCGANLEVPSDAERFDCSFCRATFKVERRNGCVRLIADAIKKVQVGTDKTAAELALTRLDEELQRLSSGLAVMQAIFYSFGCLFTALAFGVFAYLFGAAFAAVAAIAMLVGVAVRASRVPRIAALRTQLEEVQRRIAENKKIVDG